METARTDAPLTREQDIVETFVELADAMVERADAIDLLHRLCVRAVDLVECEEAGVLLLDADDRLQVMGSSSERAEAIELLQAQMDEGPCRECIARGESIASANLEQDTGRWPTFAPAAVARGFLAVRTVPMSVRGEAIGGFNLFRALPGEIGERDHQLAQGMADVATVALLQDRELRHAESVSAQLQGALASRVVIEQAKGVVAERERIDVDAAFQRLRDYARQRNLRLSEVARRVVQDDLDLGMEDALPN